MSLVVTPGYTWVNGEVETATKLNLAASPTIADGQAGVFSAISASSTLAVTGNVGVGIAAGAYKITVNGGAQLAAIALQDSSNGNKEWRVASQDSGAFKVIETGVSERIVVQAGGPTSIAGGLSVTGALSATTSVSSATLNVTGELTFGGAIFRTTSAFNNSNSTTLTAIPGLSVNITNAGVYAFCVNLYVDNGDGFKVDFSGTATASAFVAGITILSEATATYQAILTGLASSKTYPSGGYVSSVVTATGTLVCSGTGTFLPRFAQATGGGASSVHIGSNMSIRRIS